MKVVTFEAHLDSCSYLVPVGDARSCRGGFHKYLFKVHFHRPIPFYHSRSNFLSPEEVKMNDDSHALYQGIEYEQGFSPNEVFSFQQKKRQVDTQVIISAFKHSERQKLFGEDGDWRRLYFLQAIYAFADNMNHLSQLQKKC